MPPFVKTAMDMAHAMKTRRACKPWRMFFVRAGLIDGSLMVDSYMNRRECLCHTLFFLWKLDWIGLDWRISNVRREEEEEHVLDGWMDGWTNE